MLKITFSECFTDFLHLSQVGGLVSVFISDLISCVKAVRRGLGLNLRIS